MVRQWFVRSALAALLTCSSLHAITREVAVTFDDLPVDAMQRRGYRFITLDRAMEDEAYRSEDTFTGRGGISWIHRWAITAGKKGAFFAGEPTTPAWIQDVAGIKE